MCQRKGSARGDPSTSKMPGPRSRWGQALENPVHGVDEKPPEHVSFRL
jgi:hypothetical protein